MRPRPSSPYHLISALIGACLSLQVCSHKSVCNSCFSPLPEPVQLGRLYSNPDCLSCIKARWIADDDYLPRQGLMSKQQWQQLL